MTEPKKIAAVTLREPIKIKGAHRERGAVLTIGKDIDIHLARRLIHTGAAVEKASKKKAD